MISMPSTLPDDPAELKKIIAQISARCVQYESENELLREQMRKLFDRLFGRTSEKLFGGSPQLLLFDMPEVDPEADTETEEKVAIEAHSRKKPGRKPLPENLPRVEVLHDIEEDEKICGCGAALERIGEEVSEKLDIIPAIIRVIRHIRPKYGCRCCEGIEDDGPTVKIAPVPPQIIPKGIASGGLLAHILTAKFDDALPFYRQEKQFARLGVELGRATMCNWAMKAADACKPLLELLSQEIRSGPLINIDETTVQVLCEPGRPPTTKSYMWIFRGGDPDKPSLLYRYAPTRSGKIASSFVNGYEGAVQTDGYVGYNFLDAHESIVHLGCWAHARRSFMDAAKAGSSKSKKSGSVDVALGYIKKLYGIEKRAKAQQLNAEQLVAVRYKEVKPLLDKFRKWLEKKSLQVVPKSLLGKAVSYTLDQWPRLVGYLNVGDATPDNNLAENAIRPFVVGRKNWLFAGTPEGAEASAALYSLIETAKANGLDTYKYLRYLFENLPLAESEKDYRNLLPQQLTADKLTLPQSYSAV
ncbi:MAG: IS66 family transposase [Desulfobacterales bacterium]|nr:IS66 family transposase [Desulfobacterales bacterium]